MTTAETTGTRFDAHEHRHTRSTTSGTGAHGPAHRARRRPRRLWFVGAALAVALAATACLPPGSTATADHDSMVSLINTSRAANGIGPVGNDAQLDALAQNWAQQLAAAGSLSHQDLNALLASPLMAGWRQLTENVFQGGPSATNALVENAWLASSGHRANILDPGVDRVGVGVAHDGAGNTYVVADFGRR